MQLTEHQKAYRYMVTEAEYVKACLRLADMSETSARRHMLAARAQAAQFLPKEAPVTDIQVDVKRGVVSFSVKGGVS